MAKRKQIFRFSDHYYKIIGGVLIFSAISLFKGDFGLINYFRINKNINTRIENTRDLKREEIRLKAEKDKLESDLPYIEKIAREKYRMTKKGEKLTRVIDKQDSLKK